MIVGPPDPALRVDLHSHSLLSDGEHPPAEVARMGEAAGLAAMALTDHDCLDGYEEFARAARGFEPICGVEISARRANHDVHLIGLFVSPHDERLRARLLDLARHREERIPRMVARLRAAGVALTEEQVREQSAGGTVGRPHVAKALVEAGAVRTVEEAFRKFLRPGLPGYAGKPGPSPPEAIGWIHDAGGVAILAHPGPLGRDAWVEELAAAGLDGIEVWHPRHQAAHHETYLALARSLDLAPSGGSDYHGASIGDARVGQEPVPVEALERLRRRRPRS